MVQYLVIKKHENLEKLSMPVKLFILGLPGSGKSAIARYINIKVYAEGWHWAARRFNDYKILDDMFNQDTAGRFKPADSGGFDVTELETCKQRIRHRVAKPQFEEDHPVSEYIFKEYYYADDGSSIADILAKKYGVNKWRVLTIDNNRSLEPVCKSIESFIHSILNPLFIVSK